MSLLLIGRKPECISHHRPIRRHEMEANNDIGLSLCTKERRRERDTHTGRQRETERRILIIGPRSLTRFVVSCRPIICNKFHMSEQAFVHNINMHSLVCYIIVIYTHKTCIKGSVSQNIYIGLHIV